ncbi:MAG: HlyC/CorC family transporter [Hamadaea sp.]|nr:HlyC/CorC family transporter [Hamadaea sp.]NUT18399.1 HlyC/CorC family transporter [Hamadaea sp.]
MPDGHRPGLFARTLSPWIMRVLRERLSEDQLRALVTTNIHLGGDERRIIDDVWASGNSLIREVMVPRPDVVFLDARWERSQAEAVARGRHHSRFPVVDGDADNVIGFVHLRDLLAGDPGAPLRVLVREIMRLPAAIRLLPALSEMRRERHQLALVVDEYGGTAGIVTLEDLIEQLVGEIHDEYDEDDEPFTGLLPAEVEGRLSLADFARRTGVELAQGPYETLGGYLMAALGRLARVGDTVEVPGAGVTLRVLALDGRRVARVVLARVAEVPHQLQAAPVPLALPAGTHNAALEIGNPAPVVSAVLAQSRD